MDAIVRLLFISLFCLALIKSDAQQMSWSRMSEDTVYYGTEYLPDHLNFFGAGPGQVWDFRSLRAPYALSRRIIISGERNGSTYAHLMNGKSADAIVLLEDRKASVVQLFEDNPICKGRMLSYTLTPSKELFFSGILGSQTSYKGKMQTVFAWPRDMICIWKPGELPDSCRITYTIEESLRVDGEGTLYLPSEVNSAYRHAIAQKRTMKVEVRRGSIWTDVTAQVPGMHLITYHDIMRFVSADTGLPLAEMELRDDEPVRVEFKTHPLVTRIFPEEPDKPDVFAYPNPSFDIVRFQMSDLPYGKYVLKIFNILGVPIRSVDVEVDHPRKTISLDLSDLQRGTYLYRVQDNFGRTIRTKRVVLVDP